MRFRDVIAGANEHQELGRAAVLLATLEYPDLDGDFWLQRLDELGADVRQRAVGATGDFERLGILTSYLYGELKVRGNQDDYYDPRNSFLNDVIERRVGIPISLAVLLIEVGRRAEIPLVGVGFPGHFLVRHVRHPELVLDPFDEGRILTRVECAELLAGALGPNVPLRQEMLHPVSSLQILARMHYNLRAIYLRRQDLRKVKRVIERLVLLEPDDPNHRRDRGVFRLHGADPRGIDDLEHYLAKSDDVSDREEMEKLLDEARRKLAVVH